MVTPVAVRLEPMSEDEYDAYRATSVVDYAQSFIDSGSMPAAEAHQKAAADFARLLPDGLGTDGHVFWTAYDADVDSDSGQPVGMLWLHLTPSSEGLTAFGYDFSVREDLRRSGYGRAIMQAAEQECRRRGVVSVGLNVFGHNLGAQALYEQMGFVVNAIQMSKKL